MTTTPPLPDSRRRRRLAWLALVAVVLVCCAWVFVPVWLIQPFKAQTSRGVELSYALRRSALKDYWFDWKLYNPQTMVYALGQR
ncbi:MAG: hypothetical protein LC800_02090 [Acidobacteria bacterium]|nr:hypothetical protein [Acidobacteriota bacterium]